MPDLKSRFFTIDDTKQDFFVYDLPKNWWSRPYEYAWASTFAQPDDIVLDAASGFLHPLRFFLAANCKEVHSCDTDKNIELDLNNIADDLLVANSLTAEHLSKINKPELTAKIINTRCSITKLPYNDKTFDKIYCISVLEHLNDKFNRCYSQYKWLLPLYNFVKRKEILETMKEFKRVLKDDGTIILTFDYPDISLHYLKTLLKFLHMRFASDVDFELPQNAVYSESNKLNCFRAIIKKA